MIGKLAGLRTFWMFGVSVLLGKGLSLISIPLVARYLTPADYGRLELISSFVEVAGIAMSFGLADSLFRFTASVDDVERNNVAAGLAGSALVFAAVVGAVLQIIALAILPIVGLGEHSTPLAFGLATATFSGMIELPLAWTRLNCNPGRFLLFTGCRSLSQVGLTIVTLSLGYGMEGMLAGNAFVDLCVASTLMALQARETGVRVDRATIARAATYGLPLVGGALSMFVLGSCDRWFLATAVPSSQLGFYGLAVKLSLLAPLAMQPFGLWWYARRIAVLNGPDGLATSARMVSIGVVTLGAGFAVACGGAPIFVEALLPRSYAEALDYLPWLALAAALNEGCSLVNVGVYAARTGFGVLAINGAGAIVALSGYVLMVSELGVMGAIFATLSGQATRFILFYIVGRRKAPIAYDWRLCLIVVAIDASLLLAIRDTAEVEPRALALATALLTLAFIGWRSLSPNRSSSLTESMA